MNSSMLLHLTTVSYCFLTQCSSSHYCLIIPAPYVMINDGGRRVGMVMRSYLLVNRSISSKTDPTAQQVTTSTSFL